MPLEIPGQNTAADAVAAAFPFLALFDGDPTTTGTELSGNGYARQQVTFDPAASGTPGQAEGNNLPLTYPVAGGQEVSHWALYDAGSGGNRGADDAFPAAVDFPGAGTFDVTSLVLDPLAS